VLSPKVVKSRRLIFIQIGCEVYLYNTVIGLAPKSIYQSVIEKRNWNFFETDISKNNRASKFRWLLASLFFKLNNFVATKYGQVS
jgi:hypothetical protein